MEAQFTSSICPNKLCPPFHADFRVQSDGLPALERVFLVLVVDLSIKNDLIWCSVVYLDISALSTS